MVLEYGPLEGLHPVRLTIQIRDFVELVGYREALLSQPAMLIPIVEEQATRSLACFRKETRACLVVWGLVRCA